MQMQRFSIFKHLRNYLTGRAGMKTFVADRRLPFWDSAGGGAGGLDDLSDEELMVLYGKKGNIRAFEIVFRRYRLQLFGFFVRWSGSREIAEDLYQEAFIRVINSARKYRPDATFRTWMFTIARNLARDAQRRKQVRKVMTSMEAEDQPALEIAQQTCRDPDAGVQAAEIREVLLRGLQALPAEQREMFLLRESAGLDFKAAAEVAECSENTAKSRMRYALLRLREEFEKQGIVPERSQRP